MPNMPRFQDTLPPELPPSDPMSGGTALAGNGGSVIGSANGGNALNGIIINGVFYPITMGGTVIGSADGGMGNTATINMPSSAPGGMAPLPGGMPPSDGMGDPGDIPPPDPEAMSRYKKMR